MNLLIILNVKNGEYNYIQYRLISENDSNVLNKLNVESYVKNVACTWYENVLSYAMDQTYFFYGGEVAVTVKEWHFLSGKEFKILSKFL